MFGRKQGYDIKSIMLMNILRKLWVQHVMWTRSFIISTAADLGDLDVVTKRLLRNPTDFANVLKKYYGAPKADKFRELFEQHLLIAADLVNKAKAQDTAGAEVARRKWFANADDIASFLASINRYWNKKEWQAMLYDHLQMTEQEAVARLNGRYAEDVRLYDDIEAQALKMADYMSRGIQRQFGV